MIERDLSFMIIFELDALGEGSWRVYSWDPYLMKLYDENRKTHGLWISGPLEEFDDLAEQIKGIVEWCMFPDSKFPGTSCIQITIDFTDEELSQIVTGATKALDMMPKQWLSIPTHAQGSSHRV